MFQISGDDPHTTRVARATLGVRTDVSNHGKLLGEFSSFIGKVAVGDTLFCFRFCYSKHTFETSDRCVGDSPSCPAGALLEGLYNGAVLLFRDTIYGSGE